MKKHILLTFLLLLAGLFVWAQGVPQGINYQAVARDLKGEPLANHAIGIRIALLAGGPEGKSAYAETHHLTTNDLGLFQLIVGQGVPETGSDFTRVPWAEHEIWMELALDEKGDGNFLALSASRLMAVPYAFHAGTADRIKEDDGEEKTAAFWKVNGNDFTFPGPHFLGTLDVKDLVIKTSNLERMRVMATGNIFMNNSLTIGVDLNVGRDGNFGRNLDVANNARIGNDLDVDRDANIDRNVRIGQDLDVERDVNIDRDLTTGGIARFNNTAESTTKDNGSVIIEGGVGIEKNINVGGNSAVTGNSTVGGTLGVDGIATFNNTTQSTTINNGAVVIEGGVGIEKNLNVGGSTAFSGSMSLAGVLTVTNTTQSTTKDNGAIVVEGGVGIEKNLNVGGNSAVTGTLAVTGGVSFLNTTQSFTKDDGAVVLEGGLGVEKNVNVGGTLKVITSGNITNASPNTGSHVASFENTDNGSGIQIKVGAGTPHNNNNFITFLNGGGSTVGRIEGENGPADLANNREYQDARNFMIVDIAIASTAEAIAIAEEIQAGVDVTAAATSSTACVGVGACVTAPIPSFIVSKAANLIVKTANLVVQTANLASVVANLVVFEQTHAALFGITFASGAEDYAEYLPKRNLEEDFFPGEIVGVKHGYISRNTDGADFIMVISHNPAVLGGLPPDGKEADYEMVAFMGQVPTRVVGEVAPGDYILSSGFHNGMGVAKHPSKMRPEDYKRILGVAWSGSEGKDLSMINVAVGLNTNDLADLVTKQGEQLNAQQAEIAALKSQIDRTNEILAELIPGFREAAGLGAAPVRVAQVADTDHHDDVHFVHSGEGDIVYHQLSDAELEAGLHRAEEIFREAGADLNEHPFWKRIHSDAGYKEEVLANVKTKLEKAVHSHRIIDREMELLRK